MQLKAFILALCANACFCGCNPETSAAKPLAVVGAAPAVRAVAAGILAGTPVRAVTLPGEWLQPVAYRDYAAVLIVGPLASCPRGSTWNDPLSEADVAAYLAHGGTIALAGSAADDLAANAAPSVRALLASPRIVRLPAPYPRAAHTRQSYSAFLDSLATLDRTAPVNEWCLEPLGAPASLTNAFASAPAETLWADDLWNSFTETFRKSRPDFFALQPDGSRANPKGRSISLTKRPPISLCLSNPDLTAYVSEELARRFLRNPKIDTVGFRLPDRGDLAPCMCAACRQRDPVNAPPEPLAYFNGVERVTVSYPALSDRALIFAARVWNRLYAAFPDRHLAFVSPSPIPPVSVHPRRELLLVR